MAILKIENSSDYDAAEIRRVLSFVELPESGFVEVQVKKGYESSICPQTRKITLAIPDRFPKTLLCTYVPSHVLEKWKEWAIECFAHEVIHLKQIVEGRDRDEEEAEREALKAVEKFKGSPVLTHRELLDRFW